MSIAEDIANLTANFKDKKVKEVLSEMSLDQMASVWSDIRAAHDAPAEDKEAQEKDFKEKNDMLHEIVTPKKLQAQINEYMEGLANGNYSPADFTKISEFCTSFSDEFKNDTIKNTLNEMKKRLEEKRLEVEQPLSIINDKLPERINIQDLDSIIIEGDKEKISALEDKTQANGKTISFKGPEDKDLGKVSFDELGGADITFVNENNEPQHYQISADGKLTYLPEGQEPQSWTLDEIRGNQQGLTKETKQALQLAGAAKKVWNGYQKGELDNSVEKTTIVKESGNSTRIDQGKEAPKDKGPTKVDEGHEEEDPLAPTKINEDQTPQKGGEASVDSGTKNEKPTPEDELYWEEKDIIEAMFKEWFLKAANAVTNWVVHQIEYAAAGIWNEFEAALNQRKSQLKEKEEEDKKNNKTKDVYGKVRKASEKQMTPLANASKKKAQKETIEAVKAGNIDEAIANNKLLKSLEIYVDPKALLTQGAPETTVPFAMGIGTMAAKFSDDYAQASILNAQMNNPDAFKGKDINQVYADKVNEAQQILMRQMLVYQKQHPNEDPAKAMYTTIELCTKDMKKAKEIAIEDFNKDHYIENGRNPNKNEILECYEQIAAIQREVNENQNEDASRSHPKDEHRHEGDEPPAPQPKDEHGHEGEETPSPQPKDEHRHGNDEPTSLPEEANRQVDIDSKIEYIKSGLQMENADLEGREQDVIRRQQNLQNTKDIVLGGLGVNNSKTQESDQWHAPLLPEQKKPAPEFRIPMKPQGRE